MSGHNISFSVKRKNSIILMKLIYIFVIQNLDVDAWLTRRLH